MPPREEINTMRGFFSSDGSKLLTTNGLFDLTSGKPLLPLRGMKHHFAAAIAISPDGKLVAAGYREEARTVLWRAEAAAGAAP